MHRSKYRVGNKLDRRKKVTYRPKYGADAPNLSPKRAVKGYILDDITVIGIYGSTVM